MNTITFTHPYPKLFGELGGAVPYARLLDVQEVELSNLSAEFLAYDTANGAYQLPPKGAYLLLIFLKPGGIHTFTTLRRSTPEKQRYYRDLIGETLTVAVAETTMAV